MHSSNRWAYYPIALHAALSSYVAWLSGLRSDVLLLSKPPDLFSVPRCGFQPTLPITTTSRFSTSMAPGWLLSVRTCRNDIFSCNIYPTISLPSYNLCLLLWYLAWLFGIKIKITSLNAAPAPAALIKMIQIDRRQCAWTICKWWKTVQCI